MRAPRAWGAFRPLQLGPWLTLSSILGMFCCLGKKLGGGGGWGERERKRGKDGW